MTIPERRRSSRTPVPWPVRLWWDGDMMPAMADGVSDHGLCIVTARQAAVETGRAYRIDILAGTAAERSLVAEVRHADDRGRIGLATPSRCQE